MSIVAIAIALLSALSLLGFGAVGAILLIGYRKLKLPLLLYFSLGFGCMGLAELILAIMSLVAALMGSQDLSGSMFGPILGVGVLIQGVVFILALILFAIGIIKA